MNRLKLIKRVRNLTRDLSNSIFREEDILEYLEESIDRFKQVIPQLRSMVYLDTNDSIPALLPSEYHYLLALYATSRCFGQDERHYQATNYMNEFETKLDELKRDIENGEIVIVDENGNTIEAPYKEDAVVDVYFKSSSQLTDLDDGVEGV